MIMTYYNRSMLPRKLTKIPLTLIHPQTQKLSQTLTAVL